MVDYFYVPTYEVQQPTVVYLYDGYRHVLSEPLAMSLTEKEEEVVVQKEEQKEETPKERRELVLYFAFDSARLSKKEREKILTLEEGRYAVVGYADWIGTERYNLLLSKRRAEYVKKLLLERGLKVEKVEWKGEAECLIRPKRSIIKELQECRKVEVWRLF